MSSRDYNPRITLRNDDDVERKPMEKQTPGSESTRFARKRDEWEGILAEKSEGILEGIEKPATSSGRFCVVPSGSLFELPSGFRIDTNSAHQASFKRRRARASTSSGSRRVALPARNSLIRRHNSTSQARRTSGSAGPSRLARSSRASSARSSRGRAIAVSRMFSSALVPMVDHTVRPSGTILPQETVRNKLLDCAAASSRRRISALLRSAAADHQRRYLLSPDSQYPGRRA